MTHIDQLHPRIQFVSPETGELTPFGFKFLASTWEKLGGPDDAIEDVQNGEMYETGVTDSKLLDFAKDLEDLWYSFELSSNNSSIQALEKRIDELELELAPDISNLIKRLDDIEMSLDMSSNQDIENLVNRIEEIETRIDLLPNNTDLTSKINDLEVDMEMNYGA